MNYTPGNFNELPVKQRMQYGGKDAENQAERFFSTSGMRYQRYGWNGNDGYLPDAGIMNVSATLRAKPDYLVKQIGGGYKFVEVKGCGNAGLKIKLCSIEAMRAWQKKTPVLLFIWHGTNKQFAFFTLGKLQEMTQGLPVKTFENDGKEYYQIPCDRFNWQSP